MKNIRNKVAVVTGAASGIGRMLAVNLSAEGCHLSLADIDGKGLQETRELIKTNGTHVTTHTVDVSNKGKVYAYAQEVVKIHGKVDIVINNAGLTVTDTIEDIPYEDFEHVMNINFWGVVYGTKAFLPFLKRRPAANIVNISSINGFLPFPNNGPYNCSKYAVKGFNETLHQELKKTNITVTSVHPGFIKTNIVKNTRFYKAANPKQDKDATVKNFDKLTLTSADKAARIIIAGFRRNKKRLMVGPDAHVFDKMTRLLPQTMIKLMALIVEKSG
ncbi:MAG: SDR family oxidoreductase [Desulfobacterales bacterium]|nr:SDR family oxidoreductase [Desulfobacterales bacterium]MDJ0855184.1 SDR family oxidoreductase [Desulfobacterales bacterium]